MAHFLLRDGPSRRAPTKDWAGMYPVADIERLIEPSLASLGFRLVRVRLSGKHRPVLQVMVERAEAQGLSPDVGVDDCAEISRMLSALLDVEEPVRGSYMLEVSTPGIDRPLLAKQDFERFAGFDARVETHDLFEGRRRFKGRLKGVVGEAVRVELDDDGAIDLPLAEIARAKLLLSDALIAAVQREKKDRQSGPNDG